MGRRPRTCGQVVVGMVSADRVVGRGASGAWWLVVWFHALVMAHCATVRGMRGWSRCNCVYSHAVVDWVGAMSQVLRVCGVL